MELGDAQVALAQEPFEKHARILVDKGETVIESTDFTCVGFAQSELFRYEPKSGERYMSSFSSVEHSHCGVKSVARNLQGVQVVSGA